MHRLRVVPYLDSAYPVFMALSPYASSLTVAHLLLLPRQNNATYPHSLAPLWPFVANNSIYTREAPALFPRLSLDERYPAPLGLVTFVHDA
jgi:hypothetical protein